MKLLKQSGWHARARGVATALALCVALLGPALAEAGRPGGNAPPPSTTDDETLGTLPVVGPTNDFDYFRFLRDGSASFYLQGSLAEIQHSVVSIEGHNAVTIQFLDDTADNVRLTFHGRVRLVLDRNAVEAGGFQAGVMVPTTFGAGQAQFWLGADTAGPTGLKAGPVSLPVNAFLTRGALDSRVLRGQMTSAAAARTSLVVAASRNFVSFTQTH